MVIIAIAFILALVIPKIGTIALTAIFGIRFLLWSSAVGISNHAPTDAQNEEFKNAQGQAGILRAVYLVLAIGSLVWSLKVWGVI